MKKRDRNTVPAPKTGDHSKAIHMKPILVLWLAFLLLLCLWVIAEPATTMARAKKEQQECLATLKKEDRHCMAKICLNKLPQ